MFRTFLVLLVAAVMSFSTVGCGGKEKPAQQEQPAGQTGQTVTPSEGSETQPSEQMKEEAGSTEKGAEHPTPMTQPEGSGTNN